jgi:hypothetical protein
VPPCASHRICQRFAIPFLSTLPIRPKFPQVSAPPGSLLFGLLPQAPRSLTGKRANLILFTAYTFLVYSTAREPLMCPPSFGRLSKTPLRLLFLVSLVSCLPPLSCAESLKITCTPPGATVELDGVLEGTTPFEKDFPGGYFHRTRTHPYLSWLASRAPPLLPESRFLVTPDSSSRKPAAWPPTRTSRAMILPCWLYSRMARSFPPESSTSMPHRRSSFFLLFLSPTSPASAREIPSSPSAAPAMPWSSASRL